MIAFLEVFKWINDPIIIKKYIESAEGIDIVSDSQNCINTIAQKTWPKDDVIIRTHRLICKQLEILKTIHLREDFIEVYWVHSHQEEEKTVNDEVDEDVNNIWCVNNNILISCSIVNQIIFK
eukprot:317389_1